MKGIFLGNVDSIRRVYSPEQVKALGIADEVFTKEDVMASPSDAEYIFSTWGMPCFTKEEIKSCFPALSAVFYAAGSVQEFARPFLECGVRVFSAWAANAVPVAEYAAAQILLANKGYFVTSRMYREDHSLARETIRRFPGNFGCKVGILGAGMIGSRVIELLKDHDLEILVFDPFLSDERAAALGAKKADLAEIFSTCQTISNHLANNPQTVGMLNGELFEKMSDTATFINTGRGAQVVEKDLCDALSARPLATAVLDVTISEPPQAEHPFYSMPNVVLTPHTAGSTGKEVHRMAQYMIDEYRALAAGEAVQYEVTADMLRTMA